MKKVDEKEIEEKDEARKIKARLDETLMWSVLSRGTKVLKVKVIIPFIDEPFYVHYMQLTRSESEGGSIEFPDPAKLKLMSLKEKHEFVMGMQNERVWKQIDKAQTQTKEVPKKYIITKEQWEQLGEILPNIRDEIVGRINGSLEELARNFFDGPTTPR